MCRMYGDTQNTSLDKIRVRSLLSSTKPVDNPPTGNATHCHIRRAFYQTPRWQYAHLNSHSELVSPEGSGDFEVEGSGHTV